MTHHILRKKRLSASPVLLVAICGVGTAYAHSFPSPKSPEFQLEPIQELGIHGQVVDLVKRLSMILIIARRMKAAAVCA